MVKKLKKSASEETPKAEQNGERSIEIRNVGRIEEIVIPCPADGGLVVLVGENGVGKSTALNAVDYALGRDVREKPTKTFGVPGSGLIESESLGVMVKIGQSARRSGELAVQTLTDDFGTDQLIDPREVDPVSADRRRIKSLLKLKGSTAAPEDFLDLFDDRAEMDRLLSPETLKKTDLVELAGAIKRDLQARARGIEDQAGNAEKRVLVLREELSGVEAEAVRAVNIQQLRNDYAEALGRASELKVQREKYLNAVATIERLLREKADVERTAERAEAVNRIKEAKLKSLTEIASEVAELEESIRNLQQGLEVKKQAMQTAKAELELAGSEAEKVAVAVAALQNLEKQINGIGDTPEVSENQIAEAEQCCESKRGAMLDAEKLADSAEKFRLLDREESLLKTLQREAVELREVAAGTDYILSHCVQELGTEIQVVSDDDGAPRLAVPDAVRGRKYFAELSQGEKVKLVVKLAIHLVGRGGVFVLPQGYFQDLDPSAKMELADLLHGTGVVAITAKCDEGPLRVETV